MRNSFLVIAVILLAGSLVKPAYAVPTLIPLIPAIGLLVVKGVMALSAGVLFVVSIGKKRKRYFVAMGVAILIVLIIASVLF